MKYIKVRHSKRQILALGFCVILILFFIYIGISPLLSNGIFFKSSVFVIPVINAKLKMHKIANSKCTILAHNF